MVMKLPSDFDIFSSPIFTQALWSQYANERDLAGEGLGLRDLVLVVGEDEIFAAAVDVDLLAEVLDGHRGALDVPAGAALAPRAVPGGLAGLGALPEREVDGALLLLAGLDAGAGEQRILRAVRELAVVLLGRHAVVHVGPLALRRRGDVGEALVDEAGDDLDHLRDFSRGVGVDVGGIDVEVAHVVEVHVDELLDELVGGDLEAVRALDDAVIDVGEVLDVLDGVAPPAEVTLHDVEDDVAHRVADVGGVVRRDAADVHGDVVGLRLEVFDLAGEGVRETHQPESASVPSGAAAIEIWLMTARVGDGRAGRSSSSDDGRTGLPSASSCCWS